MTTQTYDVLFPILHNGTLYTPAIPPASPTTISYDDADPETLALLAEGQIVLASAPAATAAVTAAAAEIASGVAGPGEATIPVGERD